MAPKVPRPHAYWRSTQFSQPPRPKPMATPNSQLRLWRGIRSGLALTLFAFVVVVVGWLCTEIMLQAITAAGAAVLGLMGVTL